MALLGVFTQLSSPGAIIDDRSCPAAAPDWLKDEESGVRGGRAGRGGLGPMIEGKSRT